MMKQPAIAVIEIYSMIPGCFVTESFSHVEVWHNRGSFHHKNSGVTGEGVQRTEAAMEFLGL